MEGKSKCRILKRIRAQIAEANDIEWITSTCSYQGKCRGTCPKCESEVRMLEAELQKRRSLGKKIALAGISVGTMVALSACAPEDGLSRLFHSPTSTPEPIEQLMGEVPYEIPLAGTPAPIEEPLPTTGMPTPTPVPEDAP